MKKNLLITCVMLLFAITSMAQNKITISGVVTDKTGETVIGASVRVKGQESKGSITDINGKYQIVDVASNATLIFSYIGMREQEIAVNGRSTINVKMEEDSQLIDEVVVVGYGSAKKRDLTGSIVTVKADEIASKPSTNPLASIQGKVAGVQVVNTGRAGQDPEIRVRGTNSINGFKPLYVVDGLFTDNINYLNTADIESMEILKDPSSLAIFGVRGANGVIIITTKRAKIGKTMVNINSSVGWKVIYDRVGVTNAEEFKMLYNEQLISQGSDPYDYTQWTGNTDWQDEIFQTGFLTNNNVSITGATDKSKFYLGLGYVMEEGSIKTEKLNKFTVNLNSEYSVTDFLRFGFQLNGVRAKYPDAKGVDGALKAAPIAPTHDLESGLIHTLPDFQRAQVWNPLIETELRGAHNKSENYRVAGNVFGEIDILKNLTFKATFSMDYASNNGRTYQPIVKVYDPTVSGNIATLGTGKTEVSQFKENETKVQSDYVLTYTNSFDNGNHNLTATAGFTTYYNSLSRLDGARKQGVGLVIPNDPDKWFVSIGDAATATNGSTQWERSTLSMLARVIYNYKGKYLFNGSFRRDGSSAFSYTGNEWQNFFSLGGGWLMSEEEFMKDLDWMSNFKVRFGWGVVGNDRITNYLSMDLYTDNKYGIGNNTVTVLTPKQLKNSDLKWEGSSTVNLGLDLGFFDNRLNLTADFFIKNTKDLLLAQSLAHATGFSSQWQNIGKIQNKGIELSLSSTNIQTKDFNWQTNFNISFIKNTLEALSSGEQYRLARSGFDSNFTGDDYIAKVGESLGLIYGYEFDGIYQADDFYTNTNGQLVLKEGITDNTRYSGGVKPGVVKYKDQDGDGKITTADRTVIGNAMPKWFGGITNTLEYKGIDFSFMFQFNYGNDIYNATRLYATQSRSSRRNMLAEVADRWSPTNASNLVPSYDGYITNDVYSRFVEDGSFLRLKNITLGYTLPQKWTSKFYVSKLRVYATGQNLFCWNNYSGYDPEVNSLNDPMRPGLDWGAYPKSRVFTFGIDLQF